MTLQEWLAQNSGSTTFEDSLRAQGYTQNPDTGYWYTPDGSRVSTDVLQQMQDSYNPTNTYLQSAMFGTAGQGGYVSNGGATYYGANINGTPYAQIGQFANNGTDPVSSLQAEFDQLAKYGITPQYDPTYGWIAPVNDAYNQAHPKQNQSSIFDYGPILLGTAAVGGGLFGGAYDLGASSLGGDLLTAGAPDIIANGIDEALGSSLSGSELSGLSSLLPAVPTNPLGVPAEQAPAPVTEAGQAANAADIARIGAKSAAGSVLSRILSGNPQPGDWAQLLGTGAATGLGILGANQQSNAYQDMFNKYLSLGAPSRQRLEASYAPGFSVANDPGYQDALNTTTNTFLRAASAGRAPGVSGGNPFDNPGAWAETMKYVDSNVALPYLQNYRAQNAASGGLGVAQSTPSASGIGASAGSGLNAVGYGLGSVTAPTQSISDLLQQFENLRKREARINTGFGN